MSADQAQHHPSQHDAENGEQTAEPLFAPTILCPRNIRIGQDGTSDGPHQGVGRYRFTRLTAARSCATTFTCARAAPKSLVFPHVMEVSDGMRHARGAKDPNFQALICPFLALVAVVSSECIGRTYPHGKEYLRAVGAPASAEHRRTGSPMTIVAGSIPLIAPSGPVTRFPTMRNAGPSSNVTVITGYGANGA